MRLPSMTLEVAGRNLLTVASEGVYVGPFIMTRTKAFEEREVHAFELGRRDVERQVVDRWLGCAS